MDVSPKSSPSLGKKLQRFFKGFDSQGHWGSSVKSVMVDVTHCLEERKQKLETTNCYKHVATEQEVFMVSFTYLLHVLHTNSPAIIGLCGGKSGMEVLRYCATISEDCKSSIDWSNVYVFLVDERYVPCSDGSSNQKIVLETLVANTNIPECNLYFPNTELPYEECVNDYSTRLRKLFHFQRPHAVLLGMGDDGHIASLFPHRPDEELTEMLSQQALAIGTNTQLFDVAKRITVTIPVLATSKFKIIVIPTHNKTTVLNLIEEEKLMSQPLTHVLQSEGCLITLLKKVEGSSLDDYVLTIVILGASGDLAKKKTFPALFHLFCQGLLPRRTSIIGFARSESSNEEFWKNVVVPNLTKINTYYTRGEKLHTDVAISAGFLEKFRDIVSYIVGHYDSMEDFSLLNSLIKSFETQPRNNRIFYLALPPKLFGSVVTNVSEMCWSKTGWNKVIVEKPFGRDLESSDELSAHLLKHLNEDEVGGKEQITS